MVICIKTFFSVSYHNQTKMSIPNDAHNFDDGDLMFRNPTFNLGGVANQGITTDEEKHY